MENFKLPPWGIEGANFNLEIFFNILTQKNRVTKQTKWNKIINQICIFNHAINKTQLQYYQTYFLCGINHFE